MDLTVSDATINTGSGHVASFNTSVISQTHFNITSEGQPESICLLLSQIVLFLSKPQSITLCDADRAQMESRLTMALATFDAPVMGQKGNPSRLRTNVSQLRRETPSQIRSMLFKLRAVGKDDGVSPWKELAELFGRLRSITAASWKLEESLSLGCMQVHIWLGLTNAQPDTTSPELAASFVGLTECLRDLRLSEVACAVADRAVHHYRSLAQSSTSLLPLLASSLRLESQCRRDLCDHEGAYDAIAEAITIQRSIPSGPSEACTPALPVSLNYASMCLLSLYRYPDALEAAQEAVTTLQRLPDNTVGLILADSLLNLSRVHSEMENHKYALPPAQEAVDLQIHFALRDNDVLHVELAAFYGQLAAARGNLKDARGAVAASQAAVDELRSAVECSETFNSDLACHLNLLSVYLRANQECQRALETCEEAVRIQRRLASRFPHRHNTNLVAYLDSLSQCRWKLKQYMEALQLAEEAFGIYTSRSLTEDATLSLLLLRQSLYCTELGRLNDARRMIKEAIKVQRNQCNFTPTTKHKSVLAEMQKHLSSIKCRDGAYEAINTGKLAWRGSGPPSDVTNADLRRGLLEFMLVISSGVSFVFVSLFMKSGWGGAAVSFGMIEISYCLAWYNTGSPSIGCYIYGSLLVGCIVMYLS